MRFSLVAIGFSSLLAFGCGNEGATHTGSATSISGKAESRLTKVNGLALRKEKKSKRSDVKGEDRGGGNYTKEKLKESKVADSEHADESATGYLIINTPNTYSYYGIKKRLVNVQFCLVPGYNVDVIDKEVWWLAEQNCKYRDATEINSSFRFERKMPEDTYAILVKWYDQSGLVSQGGTWEADVKRGKTSDQFIEALEILPSDKDKKLDAGDVSEADEASASDTGPTDAKAPKIKSGKGTDDSWTSDAAEGSSVKAPKLKGTSRK